MPLPPSGNSADGPVPGTWDAEGWAGIDPYGVTDNWSNALSFTPRRDPLVIDLDGDGLELRAADGSVLFDHNADGIRTGTGWALPDDALLVWDRNANGAIDSGRELFGVDTIKANGLLATDGFDALRELDSNGDGLFSAADAQFAALRLWRDLDQDGVADAGELGTLAAANITSISLLPTASGALINNNRVDSTAVVARTGGLAPTTAGAIDFAENTFAREFTGNTVTGTVTLTPTAQALPQMRGSGMVRDLREAMSLGTPAGAALVAAVQGFAAANTRDAQRAALDGLVRAWGASSLHGTSLQVSVVLSPGGAQSAVASFAAQNPELFARIEALERFNGSNLLDRRAVAVAGGGEVQLFAEQVGFVNQAYDALRESVYEALVLQTRLRPYLDAVELVIDENGIRFDTAALGTLLASTYGADAARGLTDLAELVRYATPTLDAVGYDGLAALRTRVEALPADSPLRATLAQMQVFAGATLVATASGDIYLGDAVANTASGGAGDDVMDGGAGNDILYGDSGSDILRGRADNDTLVGWTGDDVLDGGAGNDVLAGGRYDTWNGYYEGWGSDTYRFGRGGGQDTIIDRAYSGGSGDVDTIEIAADVSPSQVTVRRTGNDLLVQIAGTTDSMRVSEFFSDTADAGVGQIDQVRFLADGTLWNIATLMQMVTASTGGDDTLIGYGTADTLSGGAGNDDLRGRSGDDTLRGDAGNDALSGEDGQDLLEGGDGADTLNGGSGNDTLRGGADNDTLIGWTGDDVLEGGAGDDVLAGGQYDTWNGNYGGWGSDTYRFGRASGADVVLDYGYAAGVETDTIEIAADVLPADVTVRREVNDLVLRVAGTADRVTVREFFGAEGVGTGAIEQVRFVADGTVWNTAALTQMVTVGTSGDDVLIGYSASDTLAGGAGNDDLRGRGGDDTLRGEAGSDALSGEDGNDRLEGGDGADNMNGGTGNDTLLGGADNDTLVGWTGDDVLEGGAGNDVLAGGQYDTWNGYYAGWGSDTYRFGRGAGQDTIFDFGYAAGAETDTIEVAADVAPSEVTARHEGNDLVLCISGTADQITVREFFSTQGLGTGAIEQVRFTAGGTVWTTAELMQRVLAGTAGADTLVGYAGAETLAGGDGGDTLYGRDGNDMLLGEAGADVLFGENGDDALLGGTGDDSLVGWTGDDVFDGGAGNDVLAGGQYDTWNGYYSGWGSDTYRFGRGAGQDTIFDYGYAAGAETDTIEVATDVSTADVTVRHEGDDLVVRINGTADAITVRAFFTTQGLGTGAIDQLRFTADGTVWNSAELMQRVLAGTSGAESLYGYAGADTIAGGDGGDALYGRDGNDTLRGEAGADVLYGENGNDTLLGGDGDDTLVGWTGDDVFEGGAGNDLLAGGRYDTWNGYYEGWGSDTYRFGLGGGQDTIIDRNGAAGETDTLELGAGLLAADVQLLRVNGNDLALELVGTSDRITVSSHFNGAGIGDGAIEQIRFADGTLWDSARVAAAVLTTTQGTAAAETLTGGAGADRLLGLGGNDTLTGNAGHDWLDGGAGADALSGGAGDDVYVVDSTTDTVIEAANAGDDTVRSSVTWTLGANVERLVLTGTAAVNGTGNTLANDLYGNSAANVLAGGTGNDRYFVGAGDTVTEAASAGTDTVFASVTWTLGANLEHLTLIGSSAIDGTGNTLANTITGNDAANAINGGTGADTMVGGLGDDIYTVDNAGDVVTELAGQGSDTVRSSIAYALASNVENLTLTGTSGIAGTGNALDNVLTGNSGANTLAGGEGSDTYVGGAGNDTLTDASTTSNDVYRWGRGQGNDTVTDAGGSDRIEIDAGVTAAQLTLARSANDLRIAIAAATDVLIIKNWYLGAANRIEQIRLSDGSTIDAGAMAPLSLAAPPAIESQEQQLLQAMSTFGDGTMAVARPLPEFGRVGMALVV